MVRSALVLPLLALAADPRFVEVTASFVPPRGGGGKAAIEVTFRAKDPDVYVNAEPAPRLKLDLAQAVLVERPAPAPTRTPPADSGTAGYLDLTRPLSFSVAFAPAAPKGAHSVAATVTFSYCSQREGWCRRGNAEVEVQVKVP